MLFSVLPTNLAFMKSLKSLLLITLVLGLGCALYAKAGTDKRAEKTEISYSSDLLAVSSFDLQHVSELTAMEIVPQYIEKEIGETKAGHLKTVFHPPADRST